MPDPAPSTWSPPVGVVTVLPPADSAAYRDLVDWLSEAYYEATSRGGVSWAQQAEMTREGVRTGIVAALQMLAWRQQLSR